MSKETIYRMISAEGSEILNVLIAGSILEQGPHSCFKICRIKSYGKIIKTQLILRILKNSHKTFYKSKVHVRNSCYTKRFKLKDKYTANPLAM